MKTITKISLLAASLSLALSAGSAMGEANLSHTTDGTNPAAVTAQVNFKVKIPKIMILRVGDWSTTQNTVEWDYAFGITNVADRAAVKDDWDQIGADDSNVAATGDDEANADKAADGKLNVAAFGNIGGNLLLKATSTDFTATNGGGGNQPHLSEITATDTGNITHPNLVNSGDSASVTLTATGGIVRETDVWSYQYTPPAGTLPVGGTYDANVVYTLSSV